MTIIYHRADWDGIIAGQICRQFHLENTGAEPTMIGWDYGDPVPTIAEGQPFIMTDVAIPELMGRPELLWIDHHQTSIARFAKTVRHRYCVDGVAACRLCWQYFFEKRHAGFEDYRDRKVQEPLLVRLAGEYDVWDLRDNRTVALNYGLTAYAATGASTPGYQIATMLGFEMESQRNVLDLIERGTAAAAWHMKIAADAAREYGYLIEWEGLLFFVLASVHARSSRWFAGVPSDCDGFMNWRFNGDTITFSLYHPPGREEHDLSAIAVKYGGGGHRGACGFTLPAAEGLRIVAGRAMAQPAPGDDNG